MTIRDYIVAYNATFGYIELNYGPEALRSLFARLSEEYCTHLDECVRQNGIHGCLEYWGGETGTLDREKAACEIRLRDNVFTIKMNECPSVGELRSRGIEPCYQGEITYCDHCEALYRPVVEKYGLDCRIPYEKNPDGTCAGRCLNTIIPRNH